MGSQFLDAYLDAAETDRVTPWTFLRNTLKGGQWSARYHRALMRAITEEIEAGRVVAVSSARGATAYRRFEVPADDPDEYAYVEVIG